MPPAKRRLAQTEFSADEVVAAVATATASAKKAATAAAKTAAAAVAATAAATREQNWLCSICKDLYFKPTSTPCGHTFCLTCITAALDVKEECPNCRADISCTLPLAVNIAMQEFIAENAGPLFIARKAEKSEEFYTALVDFDPTEAIAALSPDIDLRRFVGNAALKLTPLLWACKNAEGDDIDEWNELIKALLSAGADVNVRDKAGNSALYLAANQMDTAAITALLDRGARDPKALSRMLTSSSDDLSAYEINNIDAVLLRMAKDASYSSLTPPQKRTDLANMLKHGFDRTAVALFDKKVRLEEPHEMLLWAVSGDCDIFIRKLLAAKVVPVNFVFEYNQTALHIACMMGKENAALALIECGASDFRRDDFKFTPLRYAKKIDSDEVVEALEAEGCI
jgi:ankyrin repeat protein